MDIFQAYKSILNYSTKEINFLDIKVTKNPKSLSHLCTPNLLNTLLHAGSFHPNVPVLIFTFNFYLILFFILTYLHLSV